MSERNQRRAQLETNEGIRRGLQSIQDRRSKLENKGEILSVESRLKSLQDDVNKLELELDLARQSLPDFIREHTQMYIDTIVSRYMAVIDHKQKVFQRTLDSVCDAAGVAVADEVSHIKGRYKAEADENERKLVHEIQAVQQVARKANLSLVFDRDMREAAMQGILLTS